MTDLLATTRYCFILAIGAVGIAVLLMPQTVLAQSDNTNVFADYQKRITRIEGTLRDMSQRIEVDLDEFREATQSSKRLVNTLTQVEERLNQLDNITDDIASLNRKIGKTLQAATDNEFRIMQIEARLESIRRLDANGHLAFNRNGAGSSPSPDETLDTDENNAPRPSWTTNKSRFEEELDKIENNGIPQTDSEEETVVAAVPDSESVQIAVTAPSVLPDGTDEEKYQFALGLAMKNQMPQAEQAFGEFAASYADSPRSVDAMYWLGRIQYLQGSFQQAVISLSEFISQWPNDPRRVDSTIWLAESLSEFAPAEDACKVFEQLPETFDTPPRKLLTRLDELKETIGCA